VSSHAATAPPTRERWLASALERLLTSAARNRSVLPTRQPFAFSTHCGKVRKVNEDTALVSVGRRAAQDAPFLAAVVCDGMGGLEKGDEAAALAAASAVAVMISPERTVNPQARMCAAITAANTAVFQKFRGNSGAVLVALLIDDRQVVIGWIGDARIYGIARDGSATLLTRDDTVASAIEDLEGAAPDAMDALLSAIGQREDAIPHVRLLDSAFQTLVLVSDGVHRIDPHVLAWLFRGTRNPSDLVSRLVAASYWDGGRDNATALAISLDQPVTFSEEGEAFAAWVESQPQVWHILRSPDLANTYARDDASPRAESTARAEPSPRATPPPSQADTFQRAEPPPRAEQPAHDGPTELSPQVDQSRPAEQPLGDATLSAASHSPEVQPSSVREVWKRKVRRDGRQPAESTAKQRDSHTPLELGYVQTPAGDSSDKPRAKQDPQLPLVIDVGPESPNKPDPKISQENSDSATESRSSSSPKHNPKAKGNM